MGAEGGFAPVNAQEAVGPERLHESLGGTLPEDTFKLPADIDALPAQDPLVVIKQVIALPCGDHDVGIAEERGEIVLGKPGTHSLKVDEGRITATDKDILRLEIPVDQLARQGGQPLRQTLHPRGIQKGLTLLPGGAEEIPQTMGNEILLLPAVESLVESQLEMKPLDIGITAGNPVEQRDPAEHRLVEGAADFPGFVARGPEILLAEILEPEEPLAVGCGQDLGNRHAVRGEESGQRRVVPVLLLLAEVTHKDRGAARSRAVPGKDPVEEAAGASLLDRAQPFRREAGQGGGGFFKQEVLSHHRTFPLRSPETGAIPLTMHPSRRVPGAMTAPGQRMESRITAPSPTEAPRPTETIPSNETPDPILAPGSTARGQSGSVM